MRKKGGDTRTQTGDGKACGRPKQHRESEMAMDYQAARNSQVNKGLIVLHRAVLSEMITQGQSGGNAQTAEKDAALAPVGGQEEASGRCGGQQNRTHSFTLRVLSVSL